MGALHVESEPAGATVTSNGEASGVTPLDLADLPSASHEVKVELKGYAPTTQTVILSADAPRVRAEAHAPAGGAADWARPRSSRPPGCARSTSTAPGVGQTPAQRPEAQDGHAPRRDREGRLRALDGHADRAAGKQGARGGARCRACGATPTPPPEPRGGRPEPDLRRRPRWTRRREDLGTSASYPKDAPRLKSGESVSVAVTFVVTENGEVDGHPGLESGGRSSWTRR